MPKRGAAAAIGEDPRPQLQPVQVGLWTRFHAFLVTRWELTSATGGLAFTHGIRCGGIRYRGWRRRCIGAYDALRMRAAAKAAKNSGRGEAANEIQRGWSGHA